MEKLLWLLGNKVISFLLILVPIDILSLVIMNVFLKEDPTFFGVMWLIYCIGLFFFNIYFLASDFNISEIVEYFEDWWAEKPK